MTKLILPCATYPGDTLSIAGTSDRVGLAVRDTMRDGDMPEPAMVDLGAEDVDRLIAFLKVWRASHRSDT